MQSNDEAIVFPWAKRDRRATNIDLRPIKRLVAEKLDRQSPLRVLLEEDDEIPAAEFLARLPVYLALLRRSEERV